MARALLIALVGDFLHTADGGTFRMVRKIMTRSSTCTKADLRAVETRLNKKFDGIDKRFDGIDKRLDGIDKRFDGIDKRFGAQDDKFDALDRKVDGFKAEIIQHFDIVWEEMKSTLKAMGEDQRARFGQLDRRISELDNGHSQRLSDVEDVVTRHSGEIAALQRRRATKRS
jgi:hypothetical protein